MEHQNHNFMGWFDLTTSRNYYDFKSCGYYYQTTYPHYYYHYMPGQPHMTYGLNRPPNTSKRMDPYLSSIYGTEQSLYDPPISDKSSLDTTVYASSPNSCFMYEQERADMLSTLSGLSNKNGSVVSEDFDLNSQFETSRDILLPTEKQTGSAQNETCSTNINKNWPKTSSDVDFLNFDIFDMEQDVSGNPTLAELNASESLLDDFASMMDTSNKGSESINLIQASAANKQGGVGMTCQSDPKSWSSGPSQLFRTQKSKPVESASPFKSTNSIGRRPSATVTSETENSAITVTSVPKLHQLLQPRKTETDSEVSSSHMPSASSQKCQPSQLKRKQSVTSKEEMEEKWEEIKHLIYDSDADDEEEMLPRKQTRLSTDSTGYEESESDHDSQVESDSDFDDDNSQGSWSYKQETDSVQRKSRQYFWQYNLQSKGPKGARVNFEQLENDDPHILKDFEDPVFDPIASKYVTGTTIRHGGKARRGDGTDVSPNPKKLYQIGQQINKLNKQIDSFIPLSEMPVSSRNKSKKEKNKLASRACRLKKKAQHEAYKIKLFGLDMEHKQLLKLTQEMKAKFAEVLQRTMQDQNVLKLEEGSNLQLTKYLEDLAEKKYTYKVAGDTTEFVNRVLCKVEDGDPTGGLDQT